MASWSLAVLWSARYVRNIPMSAVCDAGGLQHRWLAVQLARLAGNSTLSAIADQRVDNPSSCTSHVLSSGVYLRKGKAARVPENVRCSLLAESNSPIFAYSRRWPIQERKPYLRADMSWARPHFAHRRHFCRVFAAPARQVYPPGDPQNLHFDQGMPRDGAPQAQL